MKAQAIALEAVGIEGVDDLAGRDDSAYGEVGSAVGEGSAAGQYSAAGDGSDLALSCSLKAAASACRLASRSLLDV